LYAADLAVWLWTILLRGQATRPYNVGSEAPISIANLAHAVARRFTPESAVSIGKPATADGPPERYVPSTTRVRNDLGVTVSVDLEEALTRTVDWYREGSASTHVGN
jgi:dTDP-glucose 4,6-dehydratase